MANSAREQAVAVDAALRNLMLLGGQIRAGDIELTDTGREWLFQQLVDARFGFSRLLDLLEAERAEVAAAVERLQARVEILAPKTAGKVEVLRTTVSPNANGAPDPFPWPPAAPDNVVRLPVAHVRPQLPVDPESGVPA